MKTFYFSIFILVFLFCNCTNNDDLGLSEELNRNVAEQFERLSFSSEEELHLAISNENSNLRSSSSASNSFISLMDKLPSSNLRSSSSDNITYYEALGFDSLIPNPNFAKLVNPLGELAVAGNIIKITPNGTYKISSEKLQLFNARYAQDSTLTGTLISEKEYQIEEGIFLYKTFEEDDSYVLIQEGDNMPIEDVKYESNLRASTAISEPNIDTFDTFLADRRSFIGKIIQNLIGSSKTHTINFNSNRRVRGSFYFYNYFVYSEIGVKAWTDKKNLIGWSKTASDELCVGWTRVILKQEIPDYYSQTMKTVDDVVYFPPQYMDVNGQRVNVATLVMPDFEPSLRDQMFAQGGRVIYDIIKKKYKRPDTELEKIHAYIVATRSNLYYLPKSVDDRYTGIHEFSCVFANAYANFEVGYNSQNGIFINGVSPNNYNKASTWFGVIGRAMREKKPTLVAGEVYIGARFDNNWRGMKIIKKD